MALFEFFSRLFQLVTEHFIQMSTYDDLTDFGPVTPEIQDQLVMIYSTITTAVAWLGLGYVLELQWKLANSLTAGRCLVMLAMYFLTSRWREVRRFCVLMVADLLLGASMYRMISYCRHKINDLLINIVKYDNIIVRLFVLFFIKDLRDLPAVLVGIVLVFGSFATIAKFIEIRRQMYTMSVLLSAILLFFWFLSYSTVLNKPYLIMSFSFFMGYVVAYSQEMVVQIGSGDVDRRHHAIALFTQMPAFIVHMITCCITRRTREDLSNGV